MPRAASPVGAPSALPDPRHRLLLLRGRERLRAYEVLEKGVDPGFGGLGGFEFRNGRRFQGFRADFVRDRSAEHRIGGGVSLLLLRERVAAFRRAVKTALADDPDHLGM